jgi:hypothetical protein
MTEHNYISLVSTSLTSKPSTLLGMQKRDVQEELVPTIMQQIHNQRSPEAVWEAWLEVLISAAPQLDRETAEGDVLAMALRQSKAGYEGGLQQRLCLCKLLAVAAVALKGHDEVRRPSWILVPKNERSFRQAVTVGV